MVKLYDAPHPLFHISDYDDSKAIRAKGIVSVGNEHPIRQMIQFAPNHTLLPFLSL